MMIATVSDSAVFCDGFSVNEQKIMGFKDVFRYTGPLETHTHIYIYGKWELPYRI